MTLKNSILIVDDDPDDREIVRDAFSSANGDHWNYVFIENGDRLLEHLAQGNGNLPALILLDLNMPGKDGREALKEIKNSGEYRSVPTVVFTTSSSQRDRETSYNLGANCFVTKPDTFNKLVELAKAIAKLWLPES